MLVETARKVTSGLAYKLRVDTIGELVPAEHLLSHYPVFRDAIAAGDPIAAELAIETIHMLGVRTTTAGRAPGRHTMAQHTETKLA